jgi:carboxypeptidase Taq
MNVNDSYQALITELREIQLLSSVLSVLGWDQQTHLPERGTEFRAAQKSMLAGMVHRRFTNEKISDWLQTIEGSELVSDPHSDAAVNIRETRRAYDRATKLPETLVREKSRLAVLAHQAWVDARKKADFPAFAPWLEKTISLKQQEARCIGFVDHPYDAMLDEYEPGETTANLRRVFEELRLQLVHLVQQITHSGRPAPAEILERKIPVDGQRDLAAQLMNWIGFDLNAGRLDESVHPFCTELGPHDTRITTRYYEYSFGDSFFGVLHETGHALYQQGLPPEHYGTPRGQPVSLGIHESQSRLWENLVGRSRAFWRIFLPKARTTFGKVLADVNEEQWYAAINAVQPGFIRVEADEATYNLHILLRFELEQSMMTGEIAANDVPSAWNEKMRKYLQLDPPDAAQGVLQDVHWSLGLIGYFPTYTLGNLYAAQFFEQAQADLGDIDTMLEHEALLPWLRKNIHSYGKKFRARDLVRHVTGRDLTAQPMMDHLKRKAGEVYGI